MEYSFLDLLAISIFGCLGGFTASIQRLYLIYSLKISSNEHENISVHTIGIVLDVTFGFLAGLLLMISIELQIIILPIQSYYLLISLCYIAGYSGVRFIPYISKRVYKSPDEPSDNKKVKEGPK